ncbi:hypothetical protein K388_01937 [Streptomyces sp. KhCrAH-43]|uniref:hypothetical protein n=1 Tax=unclassified Streptomyces TaxID=2593676 RepID=UPI0003705A03|nr:MULTISPECIES: hypothetical protein [unclassified Streptomyces]MYS34937.1 hypothetical protein [Streptomyces sp. SID4920]MYX65286.1 hypothetical protein [Streptomyces sp. SID8373]RAJ64742.1 hypothetical protein K388_01937 [Streptomyces sp. KhCrAH-43]
MPSLPPPRTTELYYDGAWHDISGDMREGASVRITRGVTGLGARQDPTAASCTLDNRSGAYSPRNPLSSLYGKIGRNTPWRFGVDAGDLRLDLPTSAYTLSTPDAAALDVTGDLDVRIDVAPTTWTSGQMLVNRYAPGNLAFSLMLTPAGRLLLNWSATGLSAGTYAVSTVPVPGGHRLRLRATLDVDNGASGRTVVFYTASGDGGWVQLGNPVVQAGTASIYNATAPLYIGNPVAIATTPEGDPVGRLVGRVYGMQVYAGIGGALRVDVRPEDQGIAGASTMTDGTGLVWALAGGAALGRRHTRMVGEIPAWPPSRDLSGQDRTVQIAPAGIMRRLGAGNRPLDSALRRFIIGNAPLECWPLTDGEQATQGASLLGGPPAAFVGDVPPHWGKGELASWVEPVLLTDEEATGQILAQPQPTGTAAWSVDVIISGTITAHFPSIRDAGAGSDASPRTVWNMLLLSTTTTLQLVRDVYTSDSSSSTTLTSFSLPSLFDGGTHHVRLRTVPGSSTTSWYLYVDGVLITGSSVSGVGRRLREVSYAWGFGNTAAIGYLTCWNASAPSPADVIEALGGFPGETAGARALRLSAENGVPLALAGRADESEPLGVQEPQRFLEALDTIAAADLGVMLEQRDALALTYRTRHTLYNQIPTLELDFANGEISAPFAPIDDDKLTENDVTVRRKGGASSAPAVRTDGPLSVDAIGRYDVTTELSLAADDQATQQAWWRMHVGTFDGLRYTKITVNLGNPRAYAKADQALAVDVGDLIRLQHLPADQRSGDVDLIVTGYEEEVGASAWTITYTCVPGEPWSVGVVEDPVLSRADTAGCGLAVAVSATATALPVVTTAGPVWIDSATYPGEFPFDVTVDGEQVTVAGITGVAEDRFGRTVANGWGTADSGQAWTTDGGSASAYAVTGGTGRHILPINTFLATLVPVTTPDVDLRVDFSLSAVPVGDSAYVFPVIRYADSTHMYMARVQIVAGGGMFLTLRRRDGSESQIGSAYTTGLTYTAGAWYTVRLAMTGSTISGKVWLRSGTEPDWQIVTTDTALTGAASVGVRSLLGASVSNAPLTLQVDNLYCGPQQMTVTRSVNGIVKNQPAGADVRLTYPTLAAL